jgi:hypothetical protein
LENQGQKAKDRYRKIFLCKQDHSALEPTNYLQMLSGLSPANQVILGKGLGK